MEFNHFIRILKERQVYHCWMILVSQLIILKTGKWRVRKKYLCQVFKSKKKVFKSKKKVFIKWRVRKKYLLGNYT